MDFEKRAPSVDLTSIDLRTFPSPAPTYSSTFISPDVPFTPQNAMFNATSQCGASNNPYYQSTAHESSASIRPSTTGAPLKDIEKASVKPDYQDTNHPHFARSSGPGFPSALPARSRMPRKCILVPWVLFAIFFLITLWFTSILLGARFLSILHPTLSTPTVQEIHFYVNGEALQGSVSISTTTVLPTDTVVSTASSPSPTAPLPELLPSMSKGMDGLTTVLKGRIISAPTGFTTITRRA